MYHVCRLPAWESPAFCRPAACWCAQTHTHRDTETQSGTATETAAACGASVVSHRLPLGSNADAASFATRSSYAFAACPAGRSLGHGKLRCPCRKSPLNSRCRKNLGASVPHSLANSAEPPRSPSEMHDTGRRTRKPTALGYLLLEVVATGLNRFVICQSIPVPASFVRPAVLAKP